MKEISFAFQSQVHRKEIWRKTIGVLELEIRGKNEAFQNKHILKLFFKIALYIKRYNKSCIKYLEIVPLFDLLKEKKEREIKRRWESEISQWEILLNVVSPGYLGKITDNYEKDSI